MNQTKELQIFEKNFYKKESLNSFKFFLTYTFFEKYNKPFKMNHHHYAMFEAMEAVKNREIKRLIINVPPRYSKTEIVSVGFPAWGLAHNPSSSFLHASYEQDLVLNNSNKVIDILNLDCYQKMFPETRLKRKIPSAEHWNTTKNGEFYAVSTGGGITGFGAGDIYDHGFSGAILIDDPHKVQEVKSELSRQTIINWFTDTLYSRLNNKNIPIILIMQRLHEEDLSGFLLDGGSGEEWHHLCLPAIDENGKALWRFKHTLRDLDQIKKMSAGVFAGQYMQSPTPADGGIFKDEYWRYYDPKNPPNFDYKIMTVDCAEKEKEVNDFTVMQIWGRYLNRAYLIDQQKIKTEGVNIKTFFKAFYKKYKPRLCYVEDKSAGTGLIQSIKKDPDDAIPVIPVQQKKSKYERAKDIEGYLINNLVYLPENDEDLHLDLSDFLYEHKIFPNGKHDDQVDDTTLGVKMTLQSSGLILYPEYNEELHVSEFEYDPKYPLIVGYSTKDEPVCIFAQYDPKMGQIKFLQDFVCDSLDVRRKEEFSELIRMTIKNDYEKCKKLILLNYVDEKSKSNFFDWDMVFEKKHGAIAIGYEIEPCLDDLINKTADLLVANVFNRYSNKSEKRFLVHKNCENLSKALSGGLTYANKDNGFTVKKDLIKQYPYINLGNAMHNIIYDIFLSQQFESEMKNTGGIICNAGY